ncbi:MAG TPA: SGNH/GDSL hydrolase family protein [Solirubrobacteraceae bacterium]|nr:SGNH/GDSL hydrolase family protein [Solirubrobacteraceae bacterium]
MRALSSRIWRSRWLPVAGAVVTASLIPMGLASAAPTHRQPARHDGDQGGFRDHGRWVATWAASPQTAIPGTPDAQGFNNQTVRNIVFSSVSGDVVRVRFTNTFGDQPLDIGDASIAVAGTGAATTGRSVPLTFGGQSGIQIPTGAEALSDPVRMHVPALQDLAVSVYLPDATGLPTEHSLGVQTNYVASGDHAADPSAGAYTGQRQSWYFIDSVDVIAQPQVRGTLVAFGDSITDGFASTVGANARWPNDLARRLDSRHDTLAVADEGISGDRVLTSDLCCGVNALARLDRDVLDRPGAREVILLMGINDIGFSVTPPNPVTNPLPDVSAAQIIAGYQQIIAQVHDAGLKIFGGTLTPFKGAGYFSTAGEAKREAVNHWILTSGAFDGVIDFARVVADPSDPTMMAPQFDSGDHLHPNDAGYQAMANAIPLRLLLDEGR